MGVAPQFLPGTNTRQLIDDRVMKCERQRKDIDGFKRVGRTVRHTDTWNSERVRLVSIFVRG